MNSKKILILKILLILRNSIISLQYFVQIFTFIIYIYINILMIFTLLLSQKRKILKFKGKKKFLIYFLTLPEK